ncbi:hypothetical protein BDF19DRAFT_412510 [Syncephalis fuscata]|nr:hypothetical protein BDF19DRAFT_412510 [Syncephalis fuscata]
MSLVKRTARFLRRHDYIRRALWMLLVCVLYVIIVVPIYEAYNEESVRRRVSVDRAPLFADMKKLEQRADQLNMPISDLVNNNDTSISEAENFIDILLRATGADFANGVLKVRASFLPVGTFALNNATITQEEIRGAVTKSLKNGIVDAEGLTAPSALATPVTVTLGTTTIKFSANQIMENRDLQIPFQNGNQAAYPLDKYPAFIFMKVYREQGNDTAKAYFPVPFKAHFDGAVQSISFRAFVIYDSVTEASFFIRTRRTTTTVVFSVFICVLMWFLTLGLGILWMQLVVRGREVAPPHMSVGIAILFALPGLRNSQPAVPPVGVASDMFGFVWNIMLVTIFSVSIIITYTLRWSPPAKDPAPKQAAVSEPVSTIQITPATPSGNGKHSNTLSVV